MLDTAWPQHSDPLTRVSALTTRTAETYQTARIARNRAVMMLRRKHRTSGAGPVNEATLEAVLDRYRSDDTVFVHIGLSNINAAFDADPFEFISAKLTSRFESVLNPGFTPSFRKDDGGVYHKQYSRPRFGAFSTLFLRTIDYRTDDATNSILVRGPYRFDDCNHHDTWAEDGCFAALDRDNVRYLSIGTDWLTASQIHYLESRFDVPYVRTATYDGVIYYDETTCEPVTQQSHEYRQPVTWNREKIASDLRADGVLDTHYLNGLRIFSFNARDLREALAPKIAADPYYFVT